MLTDAKVDIICDKCCEELEYRLSYKYRDYSGKNGFYDFDENEVKSLLKDNDWTSSEDGEDHYCSDCTP